MRAWGAWSNVPLESPRGAPRRGAAAALSIQPEEIKREKLLNDWRYSQHLKNDLKDRCGQWAKSDGMLSLDNVT